MALEDDIDIPGEFLEERQAEVKEAPDEGGRPAGLALVEDDFGPMDEADVQNVVRQLIDSAVEFSESELSHQRIHAQRYYNGSSDIGYEDGRSKVTVSRTRDVLRSLMPAIMRVFMQSDTVVQFKPRGENDAILAKSATQYCNVIFGQRNDGYRELFHVSLDSMMKKIGIIKVWHDDTPTRITRVAEDLDDAAYAQIANNKDLEIIEQLEDEDTGLMSVTTVQEFPQSGIKFKSIKPEDFHVNRDAGGVDDCMIMCHRENKRVSDMVEMGFSYEDMADEHFAENSTTDIEDDYRKGYVARENEDTQTAQDPSSREILVTDTYLRVDADGDGVAELRHFITVGSYHKIIFEEVVDEFPFALFYSEIEPHAFFPRCLADMMSDDQDAATSLLRGVLDNVQMSNNPMRSINENFVNLEDAMNAEIGAIIRTKQIGQIQDHVVPFIGGQTIAIMEYLDKVVESRTGVTQQAAGLHPDVMQSTTKAAVSATVNAAMAAAELIARNLAETGMTRLFRLILSLSIKNGVDPVNSQSGGAFTQLDPRLWHSQMDMKVNVGLGTGQVDEKTAILVQVATKQEQLLQQFGMSNPFCGWQNLRSTYGEILSLNGFRDLGTYFPEVDPKAMKAWQQEQDQKQQQKGQDPQIQALVQVEQAKTQAKLQIDSAKLQGDMQKMAVGNQIKVADMKMEDDRARDQSARDYHLKKAEIEAKYNAEINKAALNAEIERQRQYEEYFSGGSAGAGSQP